MTEEQIYLLLWKRLGYLESKLTPEERTDFDWKLTGIAKKITAKQLALQTSENNLKEKV